MSDPNHVFAYSPQVAHKGEMLVELERILQVDLEHLRNRSFRRFIIKWNDNLDHEAS